MNHLPGVCCKSGVYHTGLDGQLQRLILILCDRNHFPTVHNTGIHDFQMDLSVFPGHHRQGGVFIHPPVLIVAVVHLKLQFPYKICNILEAVMLRILPQHQHILIHQPDIPDTVDKLYLRPLSQPVLIEYLKEGPGGKIAHFIAVPHDINGLSKYTIPILFIGFLCQRIIPQLIRPEIKLRITASVK